MSSTTAIPTPTRLRRGCLAIPTARDGSTIVDRSDSAWLSWSELRGGTRKHRGVRPSGRCMGAAPGLCHSTRPIRATTDATRPSDGGGSRRWRRSGGVCSPRRPRGTRCSVRGRTNPGPGEPEQAFPIRRMTPAERIRGSEWELRGGSPRRDLVRRPHRGGTSARRRRCRCLSHPVRRRGWWRGRTLATRLSERVRGSSRAGVRSSHPGRAVG